MEDPRCIAALRPLADDKNIDIRVSTLKCLAVNQDVTVIPKIASTIVELETQYGGTGLTGALTKYKDPRAVAFLNPIISSPSYYLRLNAMMALRPIADESSNPLPDESPG